MKDKWIEPSNDIDVEKIMEKIRKRIEDKKKKGIYKKEEIEDIENVELLPLPDTLDVPIVYDPEDIEQGFKMIEEMKKMEKEGKIKAVKIRPSKESGLRAKLKNLLLKLKPKMMPIVNLFSFLTFSEIFENQEYIRDLIKDTRRPLYVFKEHIKILHNYVHHLTSEFTKLKIENDELRVKIKEIENKLELLENRERTLEKETVDKNEG